MTFEKMKNMSSQEQADIFKRLKAIRHNYKTANYAHQYLAGAKKVSKTLDIPLKDAKHMHSAYWKRNWAVKAVAKDADYKKIGNKYWLINPINNLYYPLRNQKDIFSVLCQGGGTYIFDMWLYNMRSEGIIPALQYHDEKLSYLKIMDGERERIEKILKESVAKVNRQLALNREMDVDVQFGTTYADVH